MPSPEQERMEALTEALLRLLKRMELTESRLARIESRLNLDAAPAPEPPQIPRVRPEAHPDSASAAELRSKPSPRPEVRFDAAPLPEQPTAAPPPPGPRARLETRMGLTLLNRIGAVTFVLGVAFFFKYAVDNRWIGETGRVILGVLAGLIALAAAERFFRRSQVTFAQGVAGAGIAILFVSFYASSALYAVLPQYIAFLLMALNTATGCALSLRYNSQAIASLGLLGGYLTPILLSTGENRPWTLFPFVLLLDIGALFLEKLRRAPAWRFIQYLAFSATYLILISWLDSAFTPGDRFVASLFSLLFYTLFVSRPVVLLFAGAQILSSISLLVISLPEPLPFLPLALAVACAGLVIAYRREGEAAPVIVLAAFWVAYIPGHSNFAAHASSGLLLAYLTPVFLLFLSWLPFRLALRRLEPRPADFLLTALNAAFYFGAAYFLLDPAHHVYAGPLAIVLAAVHFLVGRRLRPLSARSFLLHSGIALAFITLAIPIQLSGFRMTIAWALEAAALVWISQRLAAPRLYFAGGAVFSLAIARLWFLDQSVVINVAALNARFLAFAIVALSLWFASFWTERNWRALAPYVAGHVVLLWGLGLEVFDWAARYAAPADVASLSSTSLSILAAAYALILVALGGFGRLALNRILGLGLIAFVVLKLYFYDVWLISRIYRIAAFAILGLLLLATSYLYSRRKTPAN